MVTRISSYGCSNCLGGHVTVLDPMQTDRDTRHQMPNAGTGWVVGAKSGQINVHRSRRLSAVVRLLNLE